MFKQNTITTDEDEEKPNIIVENNRIYFYTDVTKHNISLLCTELYKIENKMLKIKHDYNLQEDPHIYIHIQSDGGDAFAGLAGMDTIQSCKLPVVTICDGFVASAATFLLFGGTKIVMRKHSNLLIHQIRTEFWGKYNDLCDEYKNCEKLMEMIREIYTENSSIPNKKIDTILNKELNLTPKECLKFKLIHEII